MGFELGLGALSLHITKRHAGSRHLPWQVDHTASVPITEQGLLLLEIIGKVFLGLVRLQCRWRSGSNCEVTQQISQHDRAIRVQFGLKVWNDR